MLCRSLGNLQWSDVSLCHHGYRSGLDEVPSSEEEDDEESSSSSSCGAAITMTTQMEEAEPEPSSR